MPWPPDRHKAPVACLIAAALVTPGCFLVRRDRAKMCRSVAAYPLACPPDRIRANIYKPTGGPTLGGQEVRSLCVASQEDRQVVCTETDGVWQCSEVFEGGR